MRASCGPLEQYLCASIRLKVSAMVAVSDNVRIMILGFSIVVIGSHGHGYASAYMRMPLCHVRHP